MPRLWTDTIDAHRRAVNQTVLATTARLVAQHGLRAVTMSQIAEESGIGRATLYKYFPDVDSILVTWHEAQIGSHLQELRALGDGPGDPRDRLAAVLEAYASIHFENPTHGGGVSALLHQGPHVARARLHLQDFVRDLLRECAEAGAVRDDVPAGELAGYCLHTLAAAGDLPSKAAVRRLVEVTVSGLRPQPARA